MGVHEAAPPARGDVQAPEPVSVVHRLRAPACPGQRFPGACRRFLQPRKYERSFVLGGDLGWDDDLDGPLRQPRVGDGGWVDAWLELRGGEDGGWTYDAVANPRC